jgi:CheY-like chemotaxis protein
MDSNSSKETKSSSETAPVPVSTEHLTITPLEVEEVEGATRPLDETLPWVIVLRAVGTASLMQTRLSRAIVIGRADSGSNFMPEIDLTPFDALGKGVSRKHALIAIKNQRLMLRDLNSTNGTRLNDTACVPGEEYRLRHNDEVQFGQLRLQVSFAVVPTMTDTQRNAAPTSLQKKPPIKGEGKRILIIEDDNDVGNVFRMALEYVGYRVTLVNDVTKALGYVFQGMPDAIILDLMLPDLSGVDLVRYVRKQKTTHHVPLLVVSGAIGGWQMNQALAAGADAFLGKPISVDDLVQAVGNAVTA